MAFEHLREGRVHPPRRTLCQIGRKEMSVALEVLPDGGELFVRVECAPVFCNPRCDFVLGVTLDHLLRNGAEHCPQPALDARAGHVERGLIAVRSVPSLEMVATSAPVHLRVKSDVRGESQNLVPTMAEEAPGG